MENDKIIFQCSFCKKPKTEVDLLIATPDSGVAICNNCLMIGIEVLLGDAKGTKKRQGYVDQLTDIIEMV